MTDMTQMTVFERDLARALNEYAGPKRTVDARAISRSAIATSPRRRFALPGLSVRATQRLGWLAIVALTVAALLATAFVVGQQQPRPTNTPSPSQLVVAPPSVAPNSSPAPVAFQSYYPVLIRPGEPGSVDILAGLPDGTELPIAHFAPRDPVTLDSAIPDLTRIVFTGDGSVSNDGWLALSVGWGPGGAGNEGYAIVPISNLDAMPWIVPASLATRGAWTQLTGDEATNFAALQPNDAVSEGLGHGADGLQIINPVQHTITPIAASPIGGRILWAQYDDGPVVSAPDDALGTVYGTYSLSDRTIRAGLGLSTDVGGQRPIGSDGRALCNKDGILFQDALGCGGDGLVTSTGAANTDTWDVPLTANQKLDGASFAADGASMWALVGNDPDLPLELRRMSDFDHSSIVRTIGRDIAPKPSSIGADALFAGIAPDDSKVLIMAGRLFVVPTDGSDIHAFDGTPMGFVSPDVLGIRPPVVGSPLPYVTPYQPVPTPVTTALPTPQQSISVIPALIPTSGSYVPLIARSEGTTLSIITAEPDGGERIIRAISLDGFEAGDYVAEISLDGWLYIEAKDSFGYVDLFYDLNEPGSAVWKRTANAQATQQRWGPNGLLGTDNGNTFVDPRTHTVLHPSGSVYFGGGPFLAWTADGSAVYTNGMRNLVPLDGSPAYIGMLPTWDPIGGRYVGADGQVVCDLAALFLQGAQYPDCDSDRAGVVSNATGFHDYGLELAQSMVVDATSFAADETNLWALGIDQTSTRPLELLHLGATTEVAAEIGRAQVPFALEAHQLGFGGFAPDDSMIVVTNYDYAGNPPRLYIASDGSSVTSHDGEFAGFVPQSLAATWPTVTP
jgi:hypothetical protein